MNGTLNVAIISGSKLVKRSNDGIFCVLNVGGESMMTTVVRETQNPEFENVFNLKLKLRYSDELVVKVINKLKDTECDIGHATFPLKRALSSGVEQVELLDVIQPEKKQSSIDLAHGCFAGNLKIKVQWIPDSKDILDKSVSTLAGQRPKLLRGGFYYDCAKGTYSFLRDLPIVSKIAPLFEDNLDKFLAVSSKVTGIKPKIEEPAPEPEVQAPSTEPNQNIHLLNLHVESLIGYIDEKIDGAKDSVLYVAKRNKDHVKHFAVDKTVAAVGHLQAAQDYLKTTRVAALGCKGYEKVQPWIHPIPLVGRLFRPVEEGIDPETLAETSHATKLEKDVPPAVGLPTNPSPSKKATVQ